MIDFETMPVGTTFYSVNKKYNPQRKRIEFADDEGVVWHRYDKPIVEYELRKYVLTGKLRKVVEGNWPDDGEIEPEYMVDSGSGETYFYIHKDENYFLDEREARVELDRLVLELGKDETYTGYA